MNEEQETFENYFDQIKLIWEKLGVPNKIIPFCTPLKKNPKFLIIGINHADFDSQKYIAKDIADRFSKKLPDLNTFVSHKHKFANGLKKVIQIVHECYETFDEFPNEDWVGTNRIAVQTGERDILSHYEQLENLDGYDECKEEMDELLISLISFMNPKNILCAGKKSCAGLFDYDNEAELKDMKHKKFLINKEKNQTVNIIPVQHFSRGAFHAPAAERIMDAIEEGCCEI